MAKRKKQLKLPFVDETLQAHRRYSNALRWYNVHKKKLDLWKAELDEALSEVNRLT